MSGGDESEVSDTNQPSSSRKIAILTDALLEAVAASARIAG
jgi:hypothetical protein